MMNESTMASLKESLWKQFGASIDTLQNAILNCPEAMLRSNKRFFYMIYHTLIFLDYYLTFPPPDISSPLPFTITAKNEMPDEAIDDLVPNRFYTKQELLDYLQASRRKCHTLISGLTEERLADRWIAGEGVLKKNYSLMEMLLYNMRHVQHHAAQLNVMLRKEVNHASTWISRANDDL